MPVIVIGADTDIGATILTALRRRDGEVRAFVSDEATGDALRATEVKVAIGDLSDQSHVEGALTNCFCAVLIADAAGDGRELAFADPAMTLRGWADALSVAGVTRALWITGALDAPGSAPAATPEARVIPSHGRDAMELASEVASLDDAAAI